MAKPMGTINAQSLCFCIDYVTCPLQICGGTYARTALSYKLEQPHSSALKYWVAGKCSSPWLLWSNANGTSLEKKKKKQKQWDKCARTKGRAGGRHK